MSNVLVDVIPSKYRKYVYAALTVAAIVWGAVQANDGDWRSVVGGVIVALTSATAASNTSAE